MSSRVAEAGCPYQPAGWESQGVRRSDSFDAIYLCSPRLLVCHSGSQAAAFAAYKPAGSRLPASKLAQSIPRVSRHAYLLDLRSSKPRHSPHTSQTDLACLQASLRSRSRLSCAWLKARVCQGDGSFDTFSAPPRFPSQAGKDPWPPASPPSHAYLRATS